MNQTEIRALDASWVPQIAALDRTETVTAAYTLRDGLLMADERIIEVPQWSGEWLAHTLKYVGEQLDEGASLYGAFVGDALAGVAQVGVRLRGSQRDHIQLCFLMISRPYRRQGVASRLMALCQAEARQRGARYLYISATPFSSAVGFYQRHGARLAHEVDAELLALEPDDIHLVIPL